MAKFYVPGYWDWEFSLPSGSEFKVSYEDKFLRLRDNYPLPRISDHHTLARIAGNEPMQRAPAHAVLARPRDNDMFERN